MNICIFSGRIGNDIALKNTSSGISVVEINLAVRRNSDDTDWLRCVAYDKKAEFIDKYFKKGSFIEIRSRVKVTTSDKDNVKRTYHTYEIQEVEFGGKSKEEKIYGDDSLMKDEHEPTLPPIDPFEDSPF